MQGATFASHEGKHSVLCVGSRFPQIHPRGRGCPGERTGVHIPHAQYPGRRTGHGEAEGEVALLLGALGACPSLLGRDNSRGTLQQDEGVSLQLKVVEQLAKLMGDVTAATVVWQKGKRGICGREWFWSVRCCGKAHGGYGVMFLSGREIRGLVEQAVKAADDTSSQRS